jgi:hypothetical protein
MDWDKPITNLVVGVSMQGAMDILSDFGGKLAADIIIEYFMTCDEARRIIEKWVNENPLDKQT